MSMPLAAVVVVAIVVHVVAFVPPPCSVSRVHGSCRCVAVVTVVGAFAGFEWYWGTLNDVTRREKNKYNG